MLFRSGCFITAVFGLMAVVHMNYPDKQSAPREFEGGLEAELGGPGAVRVSGIAPIYSELSLILEQARMAGDPLP